MPDFTNPLVVSFAVLAAVGILAVLGLRFAHNHPYRRRVRQ